MPSRNITDCVPQLQSAWKYAIGEWDRLYPALPKPILTCTYRSNEEQTKLYNQGRTTPGKIVTQAKAGQSKHNSNPSKAFDIAFKKDGVVDWSVDLFKKFAAIIKPKGIKWGGDWKKGFIDYPHFEL